MELCDLTFLEWSEMSASEREIYGEAGKRERDRGIKLFVPLSFAGN